MPTYVAFLRAINLGATRKFPRDAIRDAVESAGGTDVATHINTGNVRLQSRLRSRQRVEEVLEAAFRADRGFEVPTIVLTPDELCEVAADAERFAADHPGHAGGAHYVSLLKHEPTPEAIAALEAASTDGEVARVGRRAVHLLLGPAYHQARVTNTVVERHLGTATNRNLNVIRTLTEKWCGRRPS